MSHYCAGITSKKERCRRKIPLNQDYCRDHLTQAVLFQPLPQEIIEIDPVNVFEIAGLRDSITMHIPKQEYVLSYHPRGKEVQEITETGSEQKYGGDVPFFIEGDQWPHVQRPNGRVEPMVFVAQFIDPRSDKNELTQIFVPNADDINVAREGAYIRKIDLNQPLKQIWIPSPVPKGWTRPTKAAYVIQDWLVTYEIPFSNYRKHIKAALDEESDAPDFVKQKWIDDEEFPDYRDSIGSIFKIGGVGFSNVYKDYLLDYQNFFGQEDGSGDHLHIGADGHLEVDPDIRT